MGEKSEQTGQIGRRGGIGGSRRKGLAVSQGIGRDGIIPSKTSKQDFVPSFSSKYMLVLPDGWCRL